MEPKEKSDESKPSPENTTTSKPESKLCPRCRSRPPSKDRYCWVCGPEVRASAATSIKCPKCGGLWSALYEGGVCIDCHQKSEKEKERQKKAIQTLSTALGGDEAVKNFIFDNFTVTEGNKAAFEYCKTFNHEHRSLYLWGKPGHGKTHLVYALAQESHLAGLRILVIKPRELVNLFRKKDPAEESASMKWMVDLDLIVIDDLGISRITEFAIEIICDILDKRSYVGKRGIVITSNHFIDVLSQKYEDDRLASRISGNFTFVEVDSGRDWRVPH